MWSALADRWPIVALASLLLVQTLRLAWVRGRPRRRLESTRRRALAGEREAEALLRAAGYRVEARQPTAAVAYALDGDEVRVEVRADLLVRRGRQRYVAEVKTGAKATELANRATRRQILEYAHAFEVDGILLVDADRGRVSTVRVPERAVRAPKAAFGWALVFGVALALALVSMAASASR